MTQPDETYSVRCRCENCGYESNLTIPKGVRAPSKGIAGNASPCPNCGCRDYVVARTVLGGK